MDEQAPTSGISIASGRVLPEWIDFNGHMNVAYYVLAFDLGVDELWKQIGITREYIETEKCSTFAAEAHITYQRELKEDDPFIVNSQILAYDEKRIHQFQYMYHTEEKFLAATGEWMNLHVDLSSRRVTPFPETVLSALQEYTQSQGVLARPAEACRTMRVRKPIYVGVEK